MLAFSMPEAVRCSRCPDATSSPLVAAAFLPTVGAVSSSAGGHPPIAIRAHVRGGRGLPCEASRGGRPLNQNVVHWRGRGGIGLVQMRKGSGCVGDRPIGVAESPQYPGVARTRSRASCRKPLTDHILGRSTSIRSAGRGDERREVSVTASRRVGACGRGKPVRGR